MKVKIKVTKRHIRDGDSWLSNSCPVAIAIRGRLKTRKCVTVDTHGIFISGYYDLVCPSSVLSFINAFDKLQEVQPFEFTLDLIKTPTPVGI